MNYHYTFKLKLSSIIFFFSQLDRAHRRVGASACEHAFTSCQCNFHRRMRASMRVWTGAGRAGSGRRTRGPPGTGARSSPCSSARKPTGLRALFEAAKRGYGRTVMARPLGHTRPRPSSIVVYILVMYRRIKSSRERSCLMWDPNITWLICSDRPTVTLQVVAFLCEQLGHGMGQRYQPIDLKSYNFFQENVQAAIESSMSSWGGAMQRFDVGGTTYRDAPNRGNESLDPEKVKGAIEASRPPQKWSDRWQPRFHRKSLYEIKNVTGNTPFDVWSYGYKPCHRSTRLTRTWKVYGSSWNMLIEPRVSGVYGYWLWVRWVREKFLDEVKEECRSASIVTYGLTPSKWEKTCTPNRQISLTSAATLQIDSQNGTLTALPWHSWPLAAPFTFPSLLEGLGTGC